MIVLTLSKLREAFRVHPQLVGLSFAGIALEQSIYYQDKVHTSIRSMKAIYIFIIKVYVNLK